MNLLYVKDTSGIYTAESLVYLDDATQQLKARFSNWTELQTKLTALAENDDFAGDAYLSLAAAA
jgi:hypothetical protein